VDDITTELMSALRDASVLKRGIKPTLPDGVSRWHSPAELRAEGRLDSFVSDDDYHRAARHLVRHGWAAKRTTFTVVRYILTEGGEFELRKREAAAGTAAETKARLAYQQSEFDLHVVMRRAEELREQTDRLGTELVAIRSRRQPRLFVASGGTS
jgi:hypothetical protein